MSRLTCRPDKVFTPPSGIIARPDSDANASYPACTKALTC
ncbi:hypothetical protein HMPREF0208_00953 [Citrobacter koseri]|nr:hypothetical protein HMPREF0208_00953 [Citrobacter koseri]